MKGWIAAKVFSSIAIGLAVFWSASFIASANDNNQWVSAPNIDISWSDTTNVTGFETPDGCISRNNLITSIDGVLSSACVSEGSIVSYAQAAGYAYISFPGDQKYYRVDNTHGYSDLRNPMVIPNTDTGFRREGLTQSSYMLRVYKNFSKHLLKAGSIYNFQNDNPSMELKDGSSVWIPVKHVGYSENGKWLAVQVVGRGIILVNVDQGSAKLISTYAGNSVSSSPNIEFRVSNDGKYVIRSGVDVGLTVTYVAGDCGEMIENITIANPVTLASPCLERDLGNLIYERVSGITGVIEYPRFRGGDRQLVVRARTPAYPWTQRFVTLSLPGYTEPAQLDYLALGDSISSGEGDTEVKTIIQPQPSTWNNPFGNSPTPLVTLDKYYRPYTDNEEDKSKGIPREKCHVSTRSYPYYLANQMKLTKDKWGSVACSGAKSSDVYTKGKDSNSLYKGQPKGGALLASDKEKARLEDYANRSQLQATALNEFIPGRAQQIEFVKKYKPKVITLTMGANNIDFGGKLQDCLTIRVTVIVPHPTTCGWATSQKSTIGSLIQGQYDSLTSLYRELYVASGRQAKIFVAGYPRLISDGEPAPCGSNIGSLNLVERQMIVQATNYLNSVIQQAAVAAGVKYIDISDALQDGRLCDDGQNYVTGIAQDGKSELQESFHPNDYGHIKIAQKIRSELGNKTPLEADVCEDGRINCPDASANAAKPAIPSEFGTPSKQAEDKHVTSGMMKKGQSVDLKAGQYSFEPNSPFTVTLHSDPVDLGTFTANSDGSFDNSITIPSTVPAGYHTIIVSGKTYSGEPIDVVQSVVVTGNDPNDLDENGTPDNQQACGLFIVASSTDADMDGIDDACDPEISETPQLYRTRLGDPDRTYAGQAEKEHYIYIERNTRAGSVTGVSGDNDPDGDGWAIVGASQGKQYSASSVPDTGPIANFTVTGDGSSQHPYQPIVSTRAGGWGCVQYKPTSLSKVTASQSRTLTRIATNTDTCRQEASGDDVDGDGQSDNTQPLYLARQGDANKGEDAGRIYLYRNFYAAESQLGISDYTPTGTAANTIAALPLISAIGDSPNHPIFGRAFEPIQSWNLLSISKANEYIPQFNKLAIIEDSNGKPFPIILTKKQNGQCIAYKPSSTDIIKFNQQNSLVKLTSVPEGVDCE